LPSFNSSWGRFSNSLVSITCSILKTPAEKLGLVGLIGLCGVRVSQM
jgi:hypothetical protein